MSNHQTNLGPLRLALIQMRCDRGPEMNLSYAIELIGKAAKGGAKLVVLPELFCTPYFCRENTPEAKAAARKEFSVTIPGPTTDALAKAAKGNGVVLVGGSVYEKAGDRYFNSSPVFDAEGKLLGVYRKTHLPDDFGFWERDYFSNGDEGVKVFDTAVGKVAVQICYDQWFPEGARLAALKGAELIVYPTAIGDVDLIKPPNQGDWQGMWTAAQVGHAVCNNLFVAAVNRVGQEGPTNFWGGSFVADPCGRVIQKAGVAEEVVRVDCDRSLVDVMKGWRFFEERQPDRYADLTRAVKEPIRKS